MSQGISFKTCGGLGANAKLEAFFTSPNTPRTYTLEGGDLTSPIVIESTNDIEIVENLSAGQYIAKMIYQGEELSDPFVITDAVLPEVTFSPATICSGQSSTLTITGTPGAQFLVNKPGGATNIVSIGINGVGTLPGITVGGEYVVTATTSVTGQCYPFTKSVTLNTGGQVLSPTITLAPGSYCVGQPIGFRIEDGGVGTEYIISSSGSGTITTPVVASMTEFNGVFTPNGPVGLIKITGVTDTCNTTTTPQISVTAEPIPTLTGVVATCANDNTHTVSLVTNGASVTVAGISATNTSGQNWQRTGITGLTEVEVITVNAAGCENSQTIQLQSCSCPTGTLTISSTGNTCGQGTATLSYLNFVGDTPNNDWVYQWQKLLNGSWVVVQTNAWTVDPYTANTALNVVDEYRLMLENTINGCKYYSESVTVTAVLPPSTVIVPSISPIHVGDELFFSVDNIPGWTYTWSGTYVSGNTYRTNTVLPQAPGNYTVYVYICNGTCCVTKSLDYTVEPQPCNTPPTVQLVGTSTFNNSCSNIETAIAATSPGPVQYTVTTNNGSPINIGQTSLNVPDNLIIDMSVVPNAWSGTVTINVTDSNGCTAILEIPYTRSTAILSVTSDNHDPDDSLGALLDANPSTYSLARVWMVKAYKCANNVTSGSSGLGTVEQIVVGSLSHQNNIAEGYVVYDNANTCIGLTTKTANDLIVDVNNWLSSNGYNATLSWDNTTHLWTYSSPDVNNEKERLQIMYSLYTPGCNYVYAYLHDLHTLDLPCQCP